MTTRGQILDLLNRGDWACAYREQEGLAWVCRSLAPLLEPHLAEIAIEIGEVAERDASAAVVRWAGLAARVRRPLMGSRRNRAITAELPALYTEAA